MWNDLGKNGKKTGGFGKKLGIFPMYFMLISYHEVLKSPQKLSKTSAKG